jgi:outer membrane protein TolC
LSTLLGQPTGTVQALLGGPTGIPEAPAEVLVSVPAELLRRRPDIRGAEFAAMAQCSRIGIAKADLYPRFTLFGSITTQTSSGGGAASGGSGLGDFFSVSSIFYSFGPRMPWSIFNYGRIKNNVRVRTHASADARQLREHRAQGGPGVEDGLTGFLRSWEATVSAKNMRTRPAIRGPGVRAVPKAPWITKSPGCPTLLLQEENTLAGAPPS